VSGSGDLGPGLVTGFWDLGAGLVAGSGDLGAGLVAGSGDLGSTEIWENRENLGNLGSWRFGEVW